jgi:hypothetical protein
VSANQHAFPHCFENVSGARNWLQSQGMTLRDYFAAKALTAALHEFYNDGDSWTGFSDVAEHCYLWADAMLKAREAKS